ncbi:ShlB/FhaC/HecB family hemolysin secretion/activation protein [Massilia pseudoviolaceinigra]|uniref:ShlB/FhaC/HecB family hemolysin secretion/activation protein n=1 Tax=Massilia pseudoviolaceinigra TaxID=3057165 RepID=UPI002796C439|nr:ShlB/FhaC/HecB family hemolysin secretion/activation protein [Massilia sp. CCM 9206]MDQ1924878.1 ShlB/FhaC/HecB family hemolysin secretion/activation protein [Massilia sp. CCM 9206]
MGSLVRTALLLMSASAASAQQVPAQGAVTLNPLDVAQEGIRRQEERTREQQQQLQTKADLLQPAQAASDMSKLPIEKPCFVIGTITVGNKQELDSMASTVAPFVGQCVGVQGVRQIAAVLDARLIALGYVTTRVSLPQQNLSEGKLVFALHVGRVAGVKMVKAGVPGDVVDNDWGTWKNAFPLSAGDMLNIRDLEQGVEQMKRLPSQTVTTRIEPGMDADTSVVLVERTSATLLERTRASMTLDNSGSEALGRSQLSGSLSLDNAAGLNDILSLSSNINAQQPKRDHRSYSLSANYSIPWDYHTFSMSHSSSRFAQFVQGTTARFLSSGSSKTAEARWNYLAWRTASAKAGVYAAISTRRAQSFLDDVELVVQRRRTTGAQGGVTLKQYLGQGMLDLDLGYRMGVGLGSAEDDYPSAADGGLTLRPRIVSLNASYSQPLKLADRALQYSASLRLQKTSDMTLSADQISIGGRYSVRGFDGDSVLLAESGAILRNDLSTGLPSIAGIDSSAFIALDVGKVSGPSTLSLVGDTLAGLAAGIRGRWKGLVFDVSLATPVSKPERFKTRSLTPYVSITYSR